MRSRASVTELGDRCYADVLAQFALDCADERIAAVARRVAAPVTVQVLGRAGVGRAWVARGLAAAGVDVGDRVPSDIDVHVVAEVVKPEDRVAIAGSRCALVVLNKADLSGSGRGGPMAAARGRAARFAELLGVPVVPMAAHLAVCEVDEEQLTELRQLARTVEVPGAGRLLDTLDYYGVAHAVVALHAAPDADAATVTGVLRRRSGVGDVLAAIAALSAGVLYQRVRAAGAALTAVAAVRPELAAQIGGFLTAGETVLAQAALARSVTEAAALPAGDPLLRACAVDVRRGALRT